MNTIPKELLDLIDVDFPKIGEITEEVRMRTVELGVRGDVRLSTGRFYTDKELEERRYEELSTLLP
jgi:hypothetical protein